MHEKEGVIHFDLEFKKGPPPPLSFIEDLEGWRRIFYRLHILGQDPKRYGGLGFGNVSRRAGSKNAAFWVTGSQTGRLRRLAPRHYSHVMAFDAEKNWVQACGPVPPSSESMTHGSIYNLDSSARFVFHVHSPLIWTHARVLGLLTTRPDVRYGTTEMARDVKRLFIQRGLKKKKLFVMRGHRDGVIAFGRTAEEAGNQLLNIWKDAAGL